MIKTTSRLIIATICVFITACQTTPYDARKKIEAPGNFVTRTFYPGQLTQEAKSVNLFDVINDLKVKPGTSAKGESAQMWAYASWGLTGLGVVIGGMGIFQSNNSNLMLGALALGGGVGAAYFMDKNLMEGVQIHNSGPSRKKHGMQDFDFNIKLARVGLFENSSTIPVLGFSANF